MSVKTNPTVNNLRAMFEQNHELTSPPSRGRSPVGSEILRGENNRPISKVRTSFVSVERSGQMGPSNGVKKPIEDPERKAGGEGGTEPKAATDPKVNGNGVHESSSVTDKKAKNRADEEKAGAGELRADVSAPDNSEAPAASADATLEKLEAETEVGTDRTEILDTKDEGNGLKAPETAEQSQDLGEILKGAPFENEAGEKPNTAKGQEATPLVGATAAPTKTGVPYPEQSNNRSKPGKPISQPKSTRPSAINTKKAPSQAPKAAATTASKEASNGPPKTPVSPTVAGRRPPLKTVAPGKPFTKPAVPSGEPKKDLTKRASRISVGANVPGPAKADKSATISDENAKKPSIPSPPKTKPHPKSPTRPVRLPAAAMATTASSAAKLGDSLPIRSPSRASVANTSKATSVIGRTPSTNTRKPSSRPSLPAQPAPNQKPRPRTSMASMKAPEGSFLARMMRPTQSSASKTHDKVEAAPAAKSQPVKPKRKSDGSEVSAKAAASGEAQPEGSETPATTTVQEDEQTPAPEPNAEKDSAEEPVNGIEAAAPAEVAVEN
ncbi:hypothetical protein MMC31_001936 [Peltigera leucophlebia]|nr:hypothetical protein [Peltigera leucophlebia]